MRPLDSASPIPSIDTNTVPSGAKPVKFVTICVSIRWSPSRVRRLTGSMVSPVDGWVTESPRLAKMPDNTTTASAMSANRLAGCGRKLPTRSTTSRNRVNSDEGFFMSDSVS